MPAKINPRIVKPTYLHREMPSSFSITLSSPKEMGFSVPDPIEMRPSREGALFSGPTKELYLSIVGPLGLLKYF